MTKENVLKNLYAFSESLVLDKDCKQYIVNDLKKLEAGLTGIELKSELESFLKPYAFLIRMLETLQAISSSGLQSALIMVCNKPVDDLTIEDFKIKETYEDVFKFLNTFITKDFVNVKYYQNVHLSSLDLSNIKNSEVNRYSWLTHFRYIHNALAFTADTFFESYLNVKNHPISTYKFLEKLESEKYNYVPTTNHSKSKFDLKNNIFPATKFNLFKRNIELGTESPTNLLFEGKKYTYGLELETCDGRVPLKAYEDLNMTCVYDGSLKDEEGIARGGEYVTGVLTGDAGVNHLKKLVNTLLENNCKVNNKCSVHVHIGSANFNKENLIAMYLLGTKLEEELFAMFPKSRGTNVYCRRLTSIFSSAELEQLSKFDSLDEDLFKKEIDYLFDLKLFPYVKTGKNNSLDLYSSTTTLSSLTTKPNKGENKLSAHPHGNKCGYNKDMQRYCWLNFVTCLYNNRGVNAKTLEFRLHNGTLNFKKILVWLQICVAFTWFAENHQKSIFKGYYQDPKTGEKEDISLDLVIRLAYPKYHKVILPYILERKFLFLDGNTDVSELQEYNESLNLVKSFKLKELFDN